MKEKTNVPNAIWYTKLMKKVVGNMCAAVMLAKL